MSDAETVENPVEENPIVDLINHSLNQDYNKANQVFGDILGQKLDIALEQEKIRMADLVYNGTDPDEEDLDDDEDLDDTETGDDDQLEFDLESDDIEGTEEDGAVEDSEEGGIDDQGEDDSEKDEL